VKAAITGATGGLGSSFARALSSKGYELILTDRDQGALDRLAGDLSGHVETVAADLSASEDVDRLAARLTDVDLLVNNAGFGTFSMFAESNLARELDMVAVHVLASMRLCRAAIPGMIERRRGSVINVASAGAFLRFPRDATYIGTKAFLVAFTECLAIELVGTGVTIQALCPAWVRTPFTDSGDYAKVGYRSPIPGWMFTSSDTVVTSSLEALGKGRVTHIPTIRARLVVPILGSRTGQALLASLRRRRTAS
jgi:short-subunit dehydrogenase